MPDDDNALRRPPADSAQSTTPSPELEAPRTQQAIIQLGDLFGPSNGRRLVLQLSEIGELLREERVLDWDEVSRLTNLSRRTIQRAMKRGDFPRRVYLSENRSGWLYSHLLLWLSRRPRSAEEALERTADHAR